MPDSKYSGCDKVFLGAKQHNSADEFIHQGPLSVLNPLLSALQLALQKYQQQKNFDLNRLSDSLIDYKERNDIGVYIRNVLHQEGVFIKYKAQAEYGSTEEYWTTRSVAECIDHLTRKVDQDIRCLGLSRYDTPLKPMKDLCF